MSEGSGAAVFLVPYEHLYNNALKHLHPLFYILILLWIVTLFYAMYYIADRHFTRALEHLSKFCRLSPDLAGLTLLAFGNGAPDFFTAVFGAGDEPEMILGSSVGSGLVIITVIFGFVLLVARRPGQGRSLVLPDGQLQEVIPENKSYGLLSCVDVRHSIEPVGFLRSALMYLFCIGLLTLFAILKKIPFWLPLILIGVYCIYLGSVIALYFGRSSQKQRKNSVIASIALNNEELSKAIQSFNRLSYWKRFRLSLQSTCWKDEWSESWISSLFHSLLLIIKAPINIFINCTVLPLEIPEDSPSYVSLRFLHRIRCIINPPLSLFLFLFLLGPSLNEIPWYCWSIYGALSLILMIGLFLTTSWDQPPKFFVLHVLYSFCTCILWIYATSSELVSCLSSTGSLLHISPTVIGIIVLAWGNSFGDLVTDVAIAKNGSFETAVSAIFSGPVQNVLLTIGAGFFVAALQNPQHAVIISSLRSDIYLALIVLAAVMIICLVAIPLRFDFQIPRSFGFALLAIYMSYLPCALIVGLGLVKLPFF